MIKIEKELNKSTSILVKAWLVLSIFLLAGLFLFGVYQENWNIQEFLRNSLDEYLFFSFPMVMIIIIDLALIYFNFELRLETSLILTAFIIGIIVFIAYGSEFTKEYLALLMGSGSLFWAIWKTHKERGDFQEKMNQEMLNFRERLNQDKELFEKTLTSKESEFKKTLELSLTLEKKSEVFENVKNLLITHTLGMQSDIHRNLIDYNYLFQEISKHAYSALVYFHDQEIVSKIIDSFRNIFLNPLSTSEHFKNTTSIAILFQKKIESIGENLKGNKTEGPHQDFMQSQLNRLLQAMMGLNEDNKIVPVKISFKNSTNRRTRERDWHELRFSSRDANDDYQRKYIEECSIGKDSIKDLKQGDLILFWRDMTGSGVGGVLGFGRVSNTDLDKSSFSLSERFTLPSYELIRFPEETKPTDLTNCVEAITFYSYLRRDLYSLGETGVSIPCQITSFEVRIDINPIYGRNSDVSKLIHLIVNTISSKTHLYIDSDVGSHKVTSFSSYEQQKQDLFAHEKKGSGFEDLDIGHMTFYIERGLKLKEPEKDQLTRLIIKWDTRALHLTLKKIKT